jgi:hypothetical protein
MAIHAPAAVYRPVLRLAVIAACLALLVLGLVSLIAFTQPRGGAAHQVRFCATTSRRC